MSKNSKPNIRGFSELEFKMTISSRFVVTTGILFWLMVNFLGLNVEAQQASVQQYFALRQADTGDCVVAVGVKGIAPGDQIFGTFTSYEEARQALDENCNSESAEPSVSSHVAALTTEKLYTPHEEITRGRWGAVARLPGSHGFSPIKTEAGLLIEDGFFVSPGDLGKTEIIYLHDGSRSFLNGVATVLDCLDYCGSAGSMNFLIVGNGLTLWESALVGQAGPPARFSVDLTGVTELRLIAADGGNGNGEDWGGWLNLSVDDRTVSPVPETPAPIIVTSTSISNETFASPVLAIPKYDNDDSTKGIFFINLDTGNAFFIDRVKKSPLSVRSRTLNQNAFEAIGRTPGRAARPGEVLVGEIRSSSGHVTALLLVETTSGKMGYVSDLKSRSYDGTLRPVSGTPARSISSPDGNFVLVMRRGSSGKTEGCYLYHATSGKTIYIPDIGDTKKRLSPIATTTLPRMDGRVSALGLQSGNEATTYLLLIDNASGRVYHVGDVGKRPDQLSVQQDRLSLFSTFPRNASVSTPQRFVLVPIFSSAGRTESVFIFDVGSGQSALLRDARKPKKMRLEKTTSNLYEWFSKDLNRPRIMTAVPKVRSNGETEGIWIFDSATGDVLYFGNVSEPRKTKVHRVQQKTR